MNTPEKENVRDTGVRKRRLRDRKADQRIWKFRKYLIAETLEKREMLSADLQKSNFEGLFLTKSQHDGLTVDITSPFSGSPSNRNGGLIGILVQDNDTIQAVDPALIRIVPTAQNPVRSILNFADLAHRSASLTIAQVKTGPFSIVVAPERKTSGNYAVSTYLVGDADGNGLVDQSDVRLIQRFWVTQKANFLQFPGADADRDGRITAQDVRLARQNLGSSIQATILNPQAFQAPIVSGNSVSAQFRVLGRNAGYRNEFGIFLVDDAQGHIGSLLPGDAGYQKAAMSPDRAHLLFLANQGLNSVASIDLKPGQHFGTFLVANGTLQSWLAKPSRSPAKQSPNLYLSFAGSNDDRFPHSLRIRHETTSLAVEDLWRGGDRDYNDISVEITYANPVVDPLLKGISLTLDPAFDSDPKGDSITTFGNVDFVGKIDLDPSTATLGGYQVTLTGPDGKALGQTTTTSDGSFRFSVIPLVLGLHRYSATVQDKKGNTKTATIQIDYRGFDSDLSRQGWSIAERGGSAGNRGSVSSENGEAILHEGDSFLTTMSRSFVAPGGPAYLDFTYAALGFDTSAKGFVNDAFEVALLGPSGNTLVPTFASGRDAFFNVTEGNVVAAGTTTTIDGKHISLDLSGIPAGMVATIVFRLIGNDSDDKSSVTLAAANLPAKSAESSVKFFVVNSNSQATYRYGEEGLGSGSFKDTSLSNPTGAASNPTGSRVWIIDSATRKVSVYGPTGSKFGSWEATDAGDPSGVTVDNGNLWLVDRGSKSVLRYNGGANLTSGSAVSSSSFPLDAANASPSDLVTDGSTIWVADDKLAEVFVYDLVGKFLGRWKLDGDNAAPSGITKNPSGGSDLWVLDRSTKKVFQYGNGTNLRSGSQNADGTFDLASVNTSPEGIADPPESPLGHSLLGSDGRALFDTAEDFRNGSLFNLTVVDESGDIRLNTSGTTEIPPFIWVSNSNEGTVSRFDTRTGVEIGRYRTGPQEGAHSPSRTAVAGDGSVWVANRAFGIQGSVIHVLLNDFIDRNGNGIIDTSKDLNNNGKIDPNEILPWDSNSDGQPDDERIALNLQVGRNRNTPSQLQSNGVPRSIAIDANDNIWVGLFNLGQYEVYDQNGDLLKIVVTPNGQPYGAAIDADGMLWGANLSGIMTQINTETFEFVKNIQTPSRNYGITIDKFGVVWVSVYDGGQLFRYDPKNNQSTTYPGTGPTGYRGIGIDNDDNVWIAAAESNLLVRYQFAEDGITLIDRTNVPVGATPSAAVVDADGYVWTTTYGDNKAWKVDPKTAKVVPGWPIATGSVPYNYSDMTGKVRLGTTQRTGTWTEIIDAERTSAVWAGVELDTILPLDTSVKTRVRASDDAGLLSSLAWRTINPAEYASDLKGRYLEVEISLLSREPDFNPVVNSLSVISVPTPTIEINNPKANLKLDEVSTFVLDGLATAAQPILGKSFKVPNRIVSVTVNGLPVDVLDESGQFYTRVKTYPGENIFNVTATDDFGQKTTVTRKVIVESKSPGKIYFDQFQDLTQSFKAEYSRTSYKQNGRELYADISVRNTGNYPVNLPLYVAVKNISDPAVSVLNPAGTLPDGTPYYEFNGSAGTSSTEFQPNALMGPVGLSFANPNRGRFTYDLVFVGIPNRPPVFTSVPALEATIGKAYEYPATATDPDNDTLAFSLVTGPEGMTMDSVTGMLRWTPGTSQVGNFPVTICVSDGHGGSAEQQFTITSAASRANRPPVFTSLPVNIAYIGKDYRYDADAIDPDQDTLTYSLLANPSGMMIDGSTGLISWKPLANQKGETKVTVQADDSHGGKATQTFTICVVADPENHAPVIVSSPVTSLSVNGGSADQYNYEAFVIDPDGDLLKYTLVDAPDGMSIDQNSGTISWKAPDSILNNGFSISDNTFNQSDWSSRVITNGPGSSGFYNCISSGQDGGVIRVTTSVAAAGASRGNSVNTVLKREAVFYDPGVQGPIRSLNWSCNARFVSGFSPGTSIVVFQGSNLYFGPGLNVKYSGSWQFLEASSLNASDFYLYDPNSPTLTDERLHPDFTEKGEKIYFGLSAGLSNGPSSGGFSGVIDVDNWQVKVTPSPIVPVTIKVEDQRGGIDQQSFAITAYLNGRIKGSIFDDQNGDGSWQTGPQLYVSNRGAILRFNRSNGALVGQFNLDYPAGESDFIMDPSGHMLSIDGSRNRIVKLDTNSGKIIGIFAEGAELASPFKGAFGPDGNLYVANAGGRVVLKYDGMTGALLGKIGQNAGFVSPIGIGFTSDGDLYVYDGLANSRSIFRFDPVTGATKEVITNLGSSLGQIMTIDSSDKIYLGRYAEGGIYEYSTNPMRFSRVLVASGSTGFEQSNGLTVDENGILYATSGGTKSINAYDSKTGQIVRTYTSSELFAPGIDPQLTDI